MTIWNGFALGIGLTAALLVGALIIIGGMLLAGAVEERVRLRRARQRREAAHDERIARERQYHLTTVRALHPDLLRGTAGEVTISDGVLVRLGSTKHIEASMRWLAEHEQLRIRWSLDPGLLGYGTIVRWEPDAAVKS